MRLFIFLAIFLSFAASELAADDHIVVSGWTVDRIDDNFTDKDKLIVGKDIDKNKWISLTCFDNTEIITFFPGVDLGSKHSFLAKFRIDKREIEEIPLLYLEFSGKKMIMSYLSSGFFYKLRDGNTISFRIPQPAGYFDISFPLSGINDVLPYLEKACPYAPRE